MIDVHSHIVFDVDDGPKTLEESLDLIGESYAQGVRTIVSTSHRRKGMFETPEDKIFANFSKVKEEAEAAEKAVKILGGKIRDIQYFDLPGSEISRSLVIIEKIKNTPGKYPRKAGTPLREPLA